MRFLRLFGLIDKTKAMNDLESTIYMLRRSLIGYLQKNVFTPKFSNDESFHWAKAVLNTILVTDPDNEQTRIFYGKNEDKIWIEALQVKKYPELSGINGGASYLYFAEMCSTTDMMNEPNVIQSIHEIMNKSLVQSRLDDDLSRRQLKMGRLNKRYIDLKDRADQLGIYVPAAKDVCKSDRPLNVIDSIRSFTKEFSKKCIA